MKRPQVTLQDMYENKQMFAVFLRRQDGSEFISHGNPSGPALFFQRFRAREHQKDLQGHKLRGVIRRVRVTIRPE